MLRHRTIGSHVSEAVWQTVCYMAERDEISVSDFVRKAVIEHLERRGVLVATYTQILGLAEQPPLSLVEGDE